MIGKCKIFFILTSHISTLGHSYIRISKQQMSITWHSDNPAVRLQPLWLRCMKGEFFGGERNCMKRSMDQWWWWSNRKSCADESCALRKLRWFGWSDSHLIFPKTLFPLLIKIEIGQFTSHKSQMQKCRLLLFVCVCMIWFMTKSSWTPLPLTFLSFSFVHHVHPSTSFIYERKRNKQTTRLVACIDNIIIRFSIHPAMASSIFIHKLGKYVGCFMS